MKISRINNFIKRQNEALDDYKKFISRIDYRNKYILLISHNVDGSGGAPVVLYNYAKFLKKSGNKVIILSIKGGSLKYNSDDIPIYTMEKFIFLYLKEIKKMKISFCIINTLVCYNIVREISKIYNCKKIIWWIHEEKRIINKYKKKIRFPKGINVACVSEEVRDNMICINDNINYYILFYGCEDEYDKYSKLFDSRKKYLQKNNKYKISIIGRICDRKNQMQLIEAVKELSSLTDIQIEIVAGSSDEKYKKSLIDKGKNINIVGPIDRNQMYNIYLQSNLIVCTSKEDPLPVVVTEALMYKVPVIMSDKVGQAKLIKNGINGFVYDVNNIEELKEKIVVCYNNKYSDKMLEEERKLFLNEFSLKALNNHINKILEDCNE